MHATSTRPFARVAAVAAAAALVISSCGGGDDDAAPTTTDSTTETTTATTAPDTRPDTTEPTSTSGPDTADETADDDAPTTTESTDTDSTDTTIGTTTDDGGDDTGDATDTGDDGLIVVDEIGDLPQECIDALSDFLQAIEPAVSEVDWDNATISDFERISEEIADDGDAFEQATTECDNFDIAGSEESLQAFIDFAEEEAPGVIGWLEFLQNLSAPATGEEAASVDTCDEAIAYIEDLAAQGLTLLEMGDSEFNVVSQALDTISSDCTPEQVAEFFDQPDIADFLG